MTTVTSDFHVIYHHSLRADIEMLPANRSQSFTFLLLHRAYCYDYIAQLFFERRSPKKLLLSLFLTKRHINAVTSSDTWECHE